MPAPLVPINTASAEEIAALYGIGPELARRVVAHRDDHGPFATPDDLARVPSLSPDLALTLAPHIDWHIPASPASPPGTSWFAIILYAFVAIVVVWGFFQRLPGIYYWLQAHQDEVQYALGWLWATVSFLMLMAAVFLFIFFSALLELTSQPSIENRLRRIRLFFVATILLIMLSLILSNLIYYAFYAPLGWVDFLSNTRLIVSLPSVFSVFIIFAPLILALWRPSLLYNPFLARLIDIAWVILIISIMVSSWFARVEFPLAIIVMTGIIGLIGMFQALTAIRSRQPILLLLVEEGFLPSAEARQKADASAWMAWLNARLPDPEEQKQLQQALDRAYPPSRARTLLGVILFGAGGWLFLTALSAIIEYVIQEWLSGFIN